MFQISEVLKKVPFFRSLAKDGISFVVERLKFKPFDANEIICKIGDPGNKRWIIISGNMLAEVTENILLGLLIELAKFFCCTIIKFNLPSQFSFTLGNKIPKLESFPTPYHNPKLKKKYFS